MLYFVDAIRPVRDLLVDYLRERQPAMDYGSLEQLARRLGMFWADLEAHHPGIDSLHLPFRDHELKTLVERLIHAAILATYTCCVNRC